MYIFSLICLCYAGFIKESVEQLMLIVTFGIFITNIVYIYFCKFAALLTRQKKLIKKKQTIKRNSNNY